MSTQTAWASCAKCQGLFYAPFQGVCPAGGRHDRTRSYNYTTDFGGPATGNVQAGWAACPRCQGMHFAGFPGKGVCPAGGQHAEANSLPYALRHDVAAAPSVQAEWRSCRKCQGLFFGPFKGTCPAGGQHDPHGSFNYCLPYSTGDLMSIEMAYRRYNGANGPLGALVGFPSRNADGSYTQKTQLGQLTVRDDSMATPVKAEVHYLVNVGLQGVRCFGTLANWPDNTDALYAIVSLVPFAVGGNLAGPLGAPVTIRTPITDIKQGEHKFEETTVGSVVPGGSAGVYIYISLWQHKSGDPDKIRDAIHQGLNDVANQAAAVAQTLAGDPATTGGTLGDITNQKIAGVSINDLTLTIANAVTKEFFADRLIQDHLYAIYPDQVIALADQATVTRSEYTDPDLAPDIRINWPLTPADNPLLSGGGASYKAYFIVTTSTVTTPLI